MAQRPDHHRSVMALAGATLLATAWALPAPAADPPSTREKATATAPAPPSAKAGIAAPATGALKAYVDPKTGALLKAPPAGHEAVGPMAAATVPRVVVEDIPGGGKRARVPRELMMMTTATVDAGGKLTTTCAPGAPSAAPRTRAGEAGHEK